MMRMMRRMGRKKRRMRKRERGIYIYIYIERYSERDPPPFERYRKRKSVGTALPWASVSNLGQSRRLSWAI